MKKQIKKAIAVIRQPVKMKKRCKFVTQAKTSQPTLNRKLIKKTKLLLGIKGYYTNLDSQTNEEIISHYRNLWQVEKSFRICKSDLQIRPVYHWKEETIKAHVLICFTALAVCKYLEIKTGKSTQKIIQLLKSVTDAGIENKITGEKIIMRSPVGSEVKALLKTLELSY